MGSAFFASRIVGERWERDVPLPDLAATLLHHRRVNLSVLSSLPDATFESPVPDEIRDRWTAGQIVDHVVAAQRQISAPVIIALSLPCHSFVQPVDPTPPLAMNRSDAIEMLTLATEELDALLASLPIVDNASDCSVNHRFFGTLDLRAILLLTALHELDHGNQLRQLALS